MLYRLKFLYISFLPESVADFPNSEVKPSRRGTEKWKEIAESDEKIYCNYCFFGSN